MKIAARKLALGTVQFGVDYGIANREGKTKHGEALAIIRSARAAGIDVFDTAHAYGNAQSILASALAGDADARVVTKLPAIGNGGIVALMEEVLGSPLFKNGGRVYGLLLHSMEDLNSVAAPVLIHFLEELKNSGRVEKIGASIYNETQLQRLCELCTPQLLQIPMNLYDQRFVNHPLLLELKSAGCEVHVRSAFLQGLMFLSPEQLPPYFASIAGHHRRLQGFLSACKLGVAGACLGFVNANPQVDRIVCGVNDRRQLLDLLHNFADLPSMEVPHWSQFALSDEGMIDPSRWRLN